MEVDEAFEIGTATTGEDGIQRFAVLSPDDRYRYTLTRRWEGEAGGTKALWIMLNPSTADAFKDDLTIVKCMRFSALWGYDAMMVVNLFAFRTTYPTELLSASDARGPDNKRFVQSAIRSEAHPLVVCAWGGGFGGRLPRFNVEKWVREAGKVPMCLGKTRAGQPKHPSRIAYATPLEEFE